MNRREFHIRLAAAAAALACLPATARAGSARTARGRQAAGAAHDAAMARFLEDLAQGDPTALEAMQRERRIAMLAYPGMFPLDLLGPHTVFTGLMNTKVHIVWKDRTPISDAPGLNIVPNVTFMDCPDHLDVLFVPGGGMGTIAVMRDREVLNFLCRQAATARYVTSVCTGALVLGAAGLVQGVSRHHLLGGSRSLAVARRETGPGETGGGQEPHHR